MTRVMRAAAKSLQTASLQRMGTPRLMSIHCRDGRASIMSRTIATTASRQQLSEQGVTAVLNETLDEYPMASFASFLAINYGFFLSFTLGLKMVGFTAPALALAGLIGRTTKRLRIP